MAQSNSSQTMLLEADEVLALARTTREASRELRGRSRRLKARARRFLWFHSGRSVQGGADDLQPDLRQDDHQAWGGSSSGGELSLCHRQDARAGLVAGHYADQVFKNIGKGLLPLVPADRIFGGAGSGQQCDGCENGIKPHEVEYELHVAQVVYRLHLRCFGLLVAVRRGQGPVDRSTVLD